MLRARHAALIALVAVGAVVLTPGPAGAGPAPPPSHLTLEFEVSGDLAAVSGQVSRNECFARPFPDPFRAEAYTVTRFDLQPKLPCTHPQVEWRIRTDPRSSKDAPEALVVRVRYVEGVPRPFAVDCEQRSPDVQCNIRFIGSELVQVSLRGR